MDRAVLVMLLTFACPTVLRAQVVFEQVGTGLQSAAVHCFGIDSLNDRLLVGGSFRGAKPALDSPGLLQYDNGAYEAIGCGLEWDCVSPLISPGLGLPPFALCMLGADLYVGGAFQMISGDTVNYIARWDGIAWHAMGSGMDGPVYSIKAYPDGIYAAGWFNHADTVLAHGLARWDGTQWHSVFNTPAFYTGNDVNRFYDLEFYQGQLYVAGNFPGGNGRNDIATYNGTDWVSCSNGILGGISAVYKLHSKDGLLYVVGAFSTDPPYGHPDNPGNGIATWDGVEWGTLGTGTQGASNTQILNICWVHDTLMAVGRFDRIGGVPVGQVAKWTGNAWCAMAPEGYWNLGGPQACVNYKDTLVVGGSFTVAGTDSVFRIAKWVGGNHTDTCSGTVGIIDLANPEGSLFLLNTVSSAGQSLQLIAGEHVSLILVYSMDGKLTERINVMRSGCTQISVDGLTSGTYILVGVDQAGVPLARHKAVIVH